MVVVDRPIVRDAGPVVVDHRRRLLASIAVVLTLGPPMVAVAALCVVPSPLVQTPVALDAGPRRSVALACPAVAPGAGRGRRLVGGVARGRSAPSPSSVVLRAGPTPADVALAGVAARPRCGRLPTSFQFALGRALGAVFGRPALAGDLAGADAVALVLVSSLCRRPVAGRMLVSRLVVPGEE